MIKLKGKMTFYPEQYLWVISNLRAEEFHVLQKIFERQKITNPNSDPHSEVDWVQSNGWDEIREEACTEELWLPILMRLISFGLIRHAEGSLISAKNHVCIITEFGRDLMSHLTSR
jgi:hypothetical protein